MNNIETYLAELAYRREHMRPDAHQARMWRILWSAQRNAR